ncbi:MAG: Twitching mobility protein [bacterium ADurb.Bin429]|nr:MAG: Twitching mobility protein [bacterium ADurb.Bin429]
MDLLDLLDLCMQREASDLHLTLDEPPILRIHGELHRLDLPPLTAFELKRLIYAVLTDDQQVVVERDLELDCAVTLPDAERFRMNVHFQQGAVEAALRRVPKAIPTLEQLGLPVAAAELARRQDGLVLVTGPTGMGKTTTLAAMVQLINHEREALIISIEDPIEFVHMNRRSIIKQREVNTDTHSFAAALRHALRQDPEIIVVGEMRDLETISTTLTAAETGHLVLATLHTQNAPQTISRIIDVFPPHQQSQVVSQLAGCLNGVISQRLLPRADGKGRVLASEILIATPAVRNLIREQQLQQLPSLLQTSAKHGMHTMDKSLLHLVETKRITREVALAHCRDPQVFADITTDTPSPRFQPSGRRG